MPRAIIQARRAGEEGVISIGGFGSVQPWELPVTGPIGPSPDPARPAAALASGLFAGDATLAQVAAGAREVRIGNRGEDVQKVQSALVDLGFLRPPCDGIFGRGTEAAVATFQRARGLTPSGEVDAATIAALDASLPQAGTVEFFKSQLRRVMPNASERDIDTYARPLMEAMREYDIDTPARQRMFLAQIAHESGSLQWAEELASGRAYEGRTNLGNTRPGDGVRYKGRGLIQVTGRANYRELGRRLGLDLEGDPLLLLHPEVSARAAAYFFKSRGCNELADRGLLVEVTRRINGGTNGLEERRRYYENGAGVF